MFKDYGYFYFVEKNIVRTFPMEELMIMVGKLDVEAGAGQVNTQEWQVSCVWRPCYDEMLQYHSAGVCVGGSRGGDQAAAEPQEDTGQAGQEGEQGGGEAPTGHDGDRGGGPEPGEARSVGDL